MTTLREFLDKEEKANLELQATGFLGKTMERVSAVDKPDEEVWMPAEKRYEKGEWIKHELKKER